MTCGWRHYFDIVRKRKISMDSGEASYVEPYLFPIDPYFLQYAAFSIIRISCESAACNIIRRSVVFALSIVSKNACSASAERKSEGGRTTVRVILEVGE